jgi:predicted acylesterase/phospholipase RssA
MPGGRAVRRWPVALVAGMALATTAGCAAVRRPPTTVAALQRDAAPAAALDRATRDSIMARLVRRVATRGDRTLDVLMLSGGGQNGAFGVGFLRGWLQRDDGDRMPQFDLVTGISTGALQAPYALLGTPAAVDTVTALYARAATSIAPTFDWWFWLRRTGGLVNTGRYERSLESAINGQFRDDLRRAFADDRQIVFASTNFDLGVGRIWSLGDELDTTAAGLVRARTLLRAATAIPAIFPPVVVDGHVHADGGVVENVLPVLVFEDYERLGQTLAARGLAPVTVRVWVVMNIWTHAPPQVVRPSSRGQMDARSTALLFYLHQPATLTGLQNLQRAVSAEVPGVRMELRVATLPAEQSVAPGADKLFERRFMQRLDSIGFTKATSASPWDVVPSAFARPGAH